MEGFLRPFLLLLLLLQPSEYSRADEDQTELTGILGGSVTFPLRIPATQKFRNGAWGVNSMSLATVTAGNPPTVLVYDTSYEGRLRFPDRSYSLQITNLRLEDTGTYSVEFNTDKETFGYREFTLQVHKGHLPPTIACDSVTCEKDACIYTLRCIGGDGQERVTYRWTRAGSSVLSTNSILHIHQSHHVGHENFTCTAQLPKGNSSRTVSPKDFCAGQVPVPTIDCDSVTCTNETCNYTLLCVAGERGENTTYHWTGEARSVFVSTDPILRVSLRPFEAPLPITCTTRYSTSNSSRTVSPKDLCQRLSTTVSPHSGPSKASLLTSCHIILLLVLGILEGMA